jgi:hypothetical protein
MTDILLRVRVEAVAFELGSLTWNLMFFPFAHLHSLTIWGKELLSKDEGPNGKK